jgi:hypothetical protein
MILTKQVAERRRNVARYAIDPDLRRQPDQRRRQRGVLGNVDLFTVGEAAFQLLGEDGSGGEAFCFLVRERNFRNCCCRKYLR